MSDTNLVVMTGTITKAPETRYLTSAKEVTGLSIECVETWAGGSRKEYVRVIGWGEMSGALGEFGMGDRILVTGKWSSRSWEKDGTKMRTVELNARSVDLIAKSTSPKADIDDGGFDFE